jgi:hypothetical protein
VLSEYFLSLHPLLIGYGNMQLVRDDKQIQVVCEALCVMILGAHMNMNSFWK